jgi:hypothetical protein
MDKRQPQEHQHSAATWRDAAYRRVARVPTISGARTSLFVPELDRLHSRDPLARNDGQTRGWLKFESENAIAFAAGWPYRPRRAAIGAPG